MISRNSTGDTDVRAEILRCSARLCDRSTVIDRLLDSPAPFRGDRHRDWRDVVDDQDYYRYGRTYRALTLQAARPDWRLTLEEIIRTHNTLCGGREFRSTAIRVGRYSNFVHPSGIMDAMSGLLWRVNQEGVCAVKAALMHAGLVSIHPFADGNGRTARLVSAMLLVNGGNRSTLTCSAEEIAGIFGSPYRILLSKFQEGIATEEMVILGLLRMMDVNSQYAEHFLLREAFLRDLLNATLKLSPMEVDRALAEFDLGKHRTGLGRAAACALRSRVEPMGSWICGLPSVIRVAYAFQATRIQDEQADGG